MNPFRQGKSLHCALLFQPLVHCEQTSLATVAIGRSRSGSELMLLMSLTGRLGQLPRHAFLTQFLIVGEVPMSKPVPIQK